MDKKDLHEENYLINQLELIKLTVDNIKSHWVIEMDLIKNLAEYVITLQHNIKIIEILVDEPVSHNDDYNVYVFTDNTEQDIKRFQIIHKLEKQGLNYQIDTDNYCIKHIGSYNFTPVLADYKFLGKEYKCIQLRYYTKDPFKADYIVKKKTQTRGSFLKFWK